MTLEFELMDILVCGLSQSYMCTYLSNACLQCLKHHYTFIHVICAQCSIRVQLEVDSDGVGDYVALDELCLSGVWYSPCHRLVLTRIIGSQPKITISMKCQRII